MGERVIPSGLNYSDIKPEALDNMMRLVRFTPVATVERAAPNTVVRFNLQSNGFLDPYSTYVKMTVEYNDYETAIATEPEPESVRGAFLDRSAHSFINRFVLRSQGTELERIDEYDVMAALLNDMHYSNEQEI